VIALKERKEERKNLRELLGLEPVGFMISKSRAERGALDMLNVKMIGSSVPL